MMKYQTDLKFVAALIGNLWHQGRSHDDDCSLSFWGCQGQEEFSF